LSPEDSVYANTVIFLRKLAEERPVERSGLLLSAEIVESLYRNWKGMREEVAAMGHARDCHYVKPDYGVAYQARPCNCARRMLPRGHDRSCPAYMELPRSGECNCGADNKPGSTDYREQP
jgi:hypothetical protein